jgi:ParB family chromosome partitioning protein
LEQRRIEMGHARALLGLTARRQQIEVAGLVAKKACRCAKQRLWCAASSIRQPPPAESQAADPDIQRLERELADKLGAKVMFQHSASGKGKLVVSYNSLDELEGILGHIQQSVKILSLDALAACAGVSIMRRLF